MELQVLDRVVRRVTLLRSSPTGETDAIPIYRRKRKKKKNSRKLKDFEGFTKSAFKAKQTQIDTYLDRHRKSNRKRKNGWLKDLPSNLFKANRKGFRKLRKDL